MGWGKLQFKLSTGRNHFNPELLLIQTTKLWRTFKTKLITGDSRGAKVDKTNTGSAPRSLTDSANTRTDMGTVRTEGPGAGSSSQTCPTINSYLLW